MSLNGLFFGNIDEEGNLETDLDKEVAESLQKMEESGASHLLGEMFSVSGLGIDSKSLKKTEEEEEEWSLSKQNKLKLHEIKPMEGAMDYSDFIELAEDTERDEELYQKGLQSLKKEKQEEDYDEDYDDIDDEQKVHEKLDKKEVNKKEENKKVDSITSAITTQDKPTEIIKEKDLTFEEVKKAYPAFEPHGILKFTDLFANPNFKNQKYPLNFAKKVTNNLAKIKNQCPTITKEIDDQLLFNADYEPQSSPNLLNHLIEICMESELQRNPPVVDETISEVNDEVLMNSNIPDYYDPLELEDWENKIVWDISENNKQQQHKEENDIKNTLGFYNQELNEGNWEKNIAWDEEQAKKVNYPLILDLNDSNMLFEIANQEKNPENKGDETSLLRMRLLKKARKMGITGISLLGKNVARDQLDKFNLSNDLYYEAIKSGKAQKIRQTFGQIIIQHAGVAQRLQPPFFKTRLTKNDLRRWHRPPIHFPIGIELKCMPSKKVKKKKMKLKAKEEFMQKHREVTLKDDTPFVLVEYSEEYPPIIQNCGMGSLLVNYYRKKDKDDDYIHDPDVGEPIILEPTDVSPFMNFGDVEPGEFKMSLYNNLLKAPVFHHKPKATDFLLIRHSINGKSKYFIRELTDLYVAGQTYPQQDVPGPHSRRITTTIKNRLQVAAFRLIRASAKRHLKIQKLAKYFPEYNESQIRTKLKEFAEYSRSGPSVGYWKLRPNVTLPTEEELTKMCTPEMLCLFESMLVGKRHLQDAGYGKSAEQEDDENELSLTIEEQLAPWITTRNFINATQGKAMLKLYGEGDPTGRGEGFSFVRVSMKDIFLRAGEKAEEKLAEIEARPKSAHRYNVAEQQKIYREEITRIWDTQNAFLANTDDFQLTEEDSDEDIVGHQPNSLFLKRDPSLDLRTAKSSRQSSVSPKHIESPFETGSIAGTNNLEDDISVAGSIGSNKSELSKKKVLIVKRLVRKMGQEEWVTEKITHPAVIKAYMRRRDTIRNPKLNEPISVDELRKRTADQLVKVKNSKERRLNKLKAQEATQGGTIPSHLAPRGKKELIRKCGNCGELGHMKTNRKCPKYHEFN
ncbi:hypothetical protein K502DRAFT_351869 [Neoconidiobolus thromboides FSU 785]|nr:hypothetical protein K502DRAFT_351869 [Neoconidiobolus thromboides FSU 785]